MTRGLRKNEPKKFSNRKKIGQLTGAHMPERASRLRYDLTTASARKVPYQITSSFSISVSISISDVFFSLSKSAKRIIIGSSSTTTTTTSGLFPPRRLRSPPEEIYSSFPLQASPEKEKEMKVKLSKNRNLQK